MFYIRPPKGNKVRALFDALLILSVAVFLICGLILQSIFLILVGILLLGYLVSGK